MARVVLINAFGVLTRRNKTQMYLGRGGVTTIRG